MPSRIRVLDEHTINKIAAGEVIENPSSVVKELVENAMDAGSTEICVEIKGGGRQLIRISDNGCGMNADDALLCLERHATSKIRELEDIHSIYTMGFRGEAVPSIASISKFTLMTCPAPEAGKTAGDTPGTMVIVDGGKIVQCCPIARAQGTTIEVKSLFFNVPVRKKFQKSPAYDSNEILKVLSNMALGNPTIKFEFISDQKTLLTTRPDLSGKLSEKEALKLRVNEILGSEFGSATCALEAQHGDYVIKGFVGVPGYTRHNRTGQHLFINKRAVVSPLVSIAVRDGYGSALPSNRHPVYVLHLTIPGNLVDVNVHPQKREVRLRQEQSLKEMIMQAVRNGLQHSGPLSFEAVDLPQMEFARAPEMPSVMQERSTPFPFQRKADFFDRPFSEPEITTKFEVPSFSAAMSPAPNPEYKPQRSPEPAPQLFSSPPKVTPKVLATMKQFILIDASGLRDNGLFHSFDKSTGDGLCLIDQRAAHARVIFEKISEQKQHEHQKMPVQSLLIPHTFETTPVESALLINYLDQLNQVGIGIRQSGPNAFLVDGIPQVFGNTDLRSLLTEIVSAISENRGSHIVQQEHERQVAIAASRAAVTHQKKLSIEEAQSLLDQLLQCKTPFQCPMGKQTLIYISYEELAKRFK